MAVQPGPAVVGNGGASHGQAMDTGSLSHPVASDSVAAAIAANRQDIMLKPNGLLTQQRMKNILGRAGSEKIWNVSCMS